MTYEQHVYELGYRFGFKVIFADELPPDEAAAVTEVAVKTNEVVGRAVVCRPVTEETSYAVALHEVGHHVALNGQLHATKEAAIKRNDPVAYFSAQVQEEEAAWEWAEHYALEWTPVMASVRDMTLGGYRQTLAGVRRDEVALKASAQRIIDAKRASERAKTPEGQAALRRKAAPGAAQMAGWLKKDRR